VKSTPEVKAKPIAEVSSFGKKPQQKVFKRIDEDKVNFVTDDVRVTNNSYSATFGSQGLSVEICFVIVLSLVLFEGWGGTAAAHLIKVKGKDFRHEKTKKKRGSYRGGEIDVHQVASFKFDNSD
jgi:hypothetical protein